MIALIIGALLAVGALAYVLYPVFFGVQPSSILTSSNAPPSPSENAVAALREIEFDRETGKLSDTDYADLKARYTNEAIAAMRRAQSVPPDQRIDDEIEAAVRAYRTGQPSCPEHGPRPEPDAVYCSTCGRYLRDRCADCGAPIDTQDARFCASCGKRFTALIKAS